MRYLAVCLFGALAVPVTAYAQERVPVVLAQAGSVGGSIGKQGKSVSGNQDAPPQAAPAPRRKAVRAVEPDDETEKPARTGKKGCSNIVGTWNSWASGLFGQGDTVFRGDGTATHRSGIPGVWKCEGDKIRMSWGGESAKLFTVSDNKIVNADGGVGFSR